ncbi:MAG: hypothetical protein JNG89_03815 [Planctomycetaceae bacterium]|nr:hypothetical protein [Planctomycetaceae bacterium]
MPLQILSAVVILFAVLMDSAVADVAATAPASTSNPAAAAAETPTVTPPPAGTPVQPTAQTTTVQPAVATTPAQPATAPTNVPDAPPMPGAAAPVPDAMQTAVALNYCRASFHRIRRYPIGPVLAEEQEKILNNINLDGIVDREVIQLYTSVLDEINQIPMAEYERRLANQYHDTIQQKKAVWDILAIGTDVATQHYGSAIRTGVNSWWDYRVMDYQQQNDVLKIDKARLNSVVQKSAQFLDTFWQMAQKKKIPDRWLVRGDDLDALDQAMREPNAEVRLRILKRMEPFMEAYPPYWYYLARTQQELGQLFAAINTYSRVVELGGGHFRKDDMLATAFANKAGIQDYLQQPSASETAEKALTYSTDVWETNLICAQVLRHNQRFGAAEDAVLRNLDVQLETNQSRVFLVALYDISGQRDKLLRQLSDPQITAKIPAPILLRCAARLGPETTPPHVLRSVVASLEAYPRFQFGQDDFIVRASSSWLFNLATIQVYRNGVELTGQEVTAGNGYQQLRFSADSDWGNPLDASPRDMEFELRLVYPDRTDLRLVLSANSDLAGASGSVASPTRSVTARMTGGPTLRIAQIVVAEDTASEAESPAAGESAGTNPEIPTGPGIAAAPVSLDIPLPPRSESQ